MHKLFIKACNTIEEFAAQFDQMTPGAQRIPPGVFSDVWEKGGVVRVGKLFYEIEVEAKKAAPKTKKSTSNKNG
jgi:hypothetical protein